MKTEETNDVEALDLSSLVEMEEGMDEFRIYEIGYHLMPTLTEDEAEKEAGTLRALVSQHAAEVVGERTPREVHLAYAIDKKIGGTRQTFSKVLFGWIAFEAPASAVAHFKEVLDTNPNILRFIISKTTRDQVAATLADPSLDVGALEPEVEPGTVVGADTEGAGEPEKEPEEKA